MIPQNSQHSRKSFLCMSNKSKNLLCICLKTLSRHFNLKQSLLLLAANSAFSIFPVHLKRKPGICRKFPSGPLSILRIQKYEKQHAVKVKA